MSSFSFHFFFFHFSFVVFALVPDGVRVRVPPRLGRDRPFGAGRICGVAEDRTVGDDRRLGERTLLSEIHLVFCRETLKAETIRTRITNTTGEYLILRDRCNCA